ncbi:The BURPS668_1122 family of deaminases [Clostridium sp. DSM 8431]|uniref:deaminase domain-containing protein n=1 Tax=Clostridium sp. DSM 8431 TaxID=1761781 RepID=UPI0008ECEDDE|nr:deaminase domain-containing protein [Clostridium sp. DSM 8431]SFU83239.1 The BURPS668_1122 family of deaminases [Clostridium sp. DSM 8431]
MIEKHNSINTKNKRVVVSNINELLKLFGSTKEIKEKLVKNKVYDLLLEYFNKGIKFKVIDFDDLLDYLLKLKKFEFISKKISEEIREIKEIKIDRVEFDRDQSNNKSDNYKVNEEIEAIKKLLYKDLYKEEQNLLEDIEQEIKSKYLLSRDIELFKKIILHNNKDILESYNEQTYVKTIVIKLENSVDYGFIKSEIGSVEYQKFLDVNVERMERIVKNLNNYIYDKDKIYINQSNTIQDSVNIAVARFNNDIFRAVSGQNNIEKSSLIPEKPVFKSYKVNRLGQMGYGYDRAYDSEKKIIEDIHYKIGKGILKDEGNLTIITKWEPCPSCYSVINQFMKLHDKINVEVKYMKKYGEK